MNTVQPIRDINKIRKIEEILKSQSQRDYILFKLGINSGLRISDILNLKAINLRNQTHFILKEQKTGKSQKLKINPSFKVELDQYLSTLEDDEYLFQSQKGNNQPIQRMQAWRILNDVAKKVGIKSEVGCHTLRKTFGYWIYHNTNKDITIVQKLLNHSSPHVTLRYIGITQENLDEVIDNLDWDTIEQPKKTRKRNSKVKVG